MRRFVQSMTIAIAFFALTIPSSIAAERLLERTRPLSVSWGDVEVSESSGVKITSHQEEFVYPYALSLTFKGRERREELESLRGGSNVRPISRISTGGTIWLAASMDGGREGWNNFTRALEATVGQLTPSAYDDFLRGFAMDVSSLYLRSGETERARIAFCVAKPEGQIASGEAFMRITKDPGGKPNVEAGMNGFKKSDRTLCAPLQQTFQGASITEVLTTGFTVEENLVESLDLQLQDRTSGAEPLALPEGAHVSRQEAPEGTSDYASVDSRDGVVHAKMLRRGPPASAGGTPTAYVLAVDLPDANLPRNLSQGRSLVMRWDLGLRLRRQGAPPRDITEEHSYMLVGVFCTSSDCTPDAGAIQGAATQRLGEAEGLLDTKILRRALEPSIFPADAFEVFCLPGDGREPTATWCLSNACAKVLNPGPVCDDLSRTVSE